ncbi:MAG TPA: serine--tRNA ligase [Armatimonadota bacterium]|nr:serine--tRNA ligase [Armatimonadota bacterium]
MIDPKVFRENPEKAKWACEVKNAKVDVDRITALDEERRDCLYQVEQRRAEKKTISKGIGQAIGDAKKAGKDVTPEEIRAEFQVQLDKLDAEMEEIDARLDAAEKEYNELLLWMPNIPTEDSPLGFTEDENVEVHAWRGTPVFPFQAKTHWDLGEELGILDIEAAVRMSGSQFVLTKGRGAQLERALINFMLDMHTREHGYTEICPPYMTLPETVLGTAHLPKFEEDLYKLREGAYLIPTAEVPLTALHFGEIIPGEELPLYYTAYTPCWRSEAGSAGKESRGMVRLHQFHKVELMKYCKPEDEDRELEKLTENAEAVLKSLRLPFRRVQLCAGEMSFAAVKAYDLEVWMPGMNKYLEISSCSRYEGFQSRRCNTRYRDEKGQKPQFVSTMNGSGLACGRTFAAILENYQQEDGSVIIPEALRPYMGGTSHILPPKVTED